MCVSLFDNFIQKLKTEKKGYDEILREMKCVVFLSKKYHIFCDNYKSHFYMLIAITSLLYPIYCMIFYSSTLYLKKI